MSFKGKSNTAGRPPNSQNRTTKIVRESFQLLVENNLKQLESDLRELEPKDRIQAVLQLSKFILPQLKALEVSDITPARVQPLTINLN